MQNEYTKQNMAVVKESLNLLEEEELIEEVRKYPVLDSKSHKGHMERDGVNIAWK